MDLNKLKNTWQNADHVVKQDNLDIEKFLSKKPTTIFTKIRRNIIVETIVNIVFLIVLPFLPVKYIGDGELFFWVNYIMVTVIYLVLLFRIRKIFKRINTSNTLLETIVKTKDLYEKYIRIYKFVSYIMVFLGMLLGLVFRFYSKDSHPLILEGIKGENMAYFIMAIIGFSTLMVLAVKYYIYFVYEKHLVKLKKNLEELIHIES